MNFNAQHSLENVLSSLCQARTNNELKDRVYKYLAAWNFPQLSAPASVPLRRCPVNFSCFTKTAGMRLFTRRLRFHWIYALRFSTKTLPSSTGGLLINVHFFFFLPNSLAFGWVFIRPWQYFRDRSSIDWMIDRSNEYLVKNIARASSCKIWLIWCFELL